MSNDLGPMTVIRKHGNESIHSGGKPSGLVLSHFWQWAYSDLVGNTERGAFAEYLVAVAIEKADAVRIGWDAFDLKTKKNIKVEVKSASYVQSWMQKELSNISFSVRETHHWNYLTNESEKDTKRQSDVYVFALLAHQDKRTIDPLNVGQWEFYIIGTRRLTAAVGAQKTISLSKLIEIGALKVAFDRIPSAIDQACPERGV